MEINLLLQKKTGRGGGKQREMTEGSRGKRQGGEREPSRGDSYISPEDHQRREFCFENIINFCISKCPQNHLSLKGESYIPYSCPPIGLTSQHFLIQILNSNHAKQLQLVIEPTLVRLRIKCAIVTPFVKPSLFLPPYLFNSNILFSNHLVLRLLFNTDSSLHLTAKCLLICWILLQVRGRYKTVLYARLRSASTNSSHLRMNTYPASQKPRVFRIRALTRLDK